MKLILTIAPLFFALLCYPQRESKEKTESSVVVNLTDKLKVPFMDRKYFKFNDSLLPRYQWNHNGGYCGEVSIISAGLYYGQYLSQYDARKIISKTQHIQGEMLLGNNNSLALADSLRLKYDKIQTQDSREFLTWVKSHVIQGHPVIIGVMDNLPGSNDPQYDHIVPVVGIRSNNPFSDKKYDSTDVILFSDNGLMTVNGSNPSVPINGNALYYYQYTFKDFLGDRKKASNGNGQPYTLVNLPNKIMSDTIYNYAMAITGVCDDKTFPIKISTNYNYEAPSIKHKSDTRPDSMVLQLTVKVSGLTPKTKYNLYQYSREGDVPRKDFNNKTNRYKELIEFTLSSGTEFTLSLNIQSDEKVFFRCVKAE